MWERFYVLHYWRDGPEAECGPSTLRYYDKEGLLPFVERSSGGIRMFKDEDMEWLRLLGCLKRRGCR